MAGSIIMSGVKEFQAKMNEYDKMMSVAARNTVVQGGQIIQKNARAEFTSAGNGRKGKHVGPPGGPPNRRSGNLQRSIQTSKPEELSPGRWVTETGPRAIYGRRIELGFRGKSQARHVAPHDRSTGRGKNKKTTRVASHVRSSHDISQPPYPYLAPGLKKSMFEIKQIAERNWKKVG